MKDELRVKGALAQKAARRLANLSSTEKDRGLRLIAQRLCSHEGEILLANSLDVAAAREKGMAETLVDRLSLNRERIEAMAADTLKIADLADPVGEVVAMWQRPNGLQIGQRRVPLGVVGIIYESRPNVTVDAAGLCLKSGNAVLLRGGSEALRSNRALVGVIAAALAEAGLPPAVQLVEDTSRETAREMMRLNQYLDVLIPRGGAGLIRTVVENATVPVIETGTGNCHVYVDGAADLEMAERIIVNAKTSRPGVCNAAETLLVDEKVARTFLPRACRTLQDLGVEIRGCQRTQEICPQVQAATDADWATEYLDYTLAVRVVPGIGAAIDHIHQYGTKHSEAIVTDSYPHSQRFLQEVDAAAVYVNASTRFTDGTEFGFGAEIGISNQKLHARGPMGLKELTTIKYIIYGSGQIR